DLRYLQSFPTRRSSDLFNFGKKAEFLSFQNTYHQFYVSGVLGIILFLFSFLLPHCAVSSSSEKKTLTDVLGLKAFGLFKQRKMADRKSTRLNSSHVKIS